MVGLLVEGVKIFDGSQTQEGQAMLTDCSLVDRTVIYRYLPLYTVRDGQVWAMGRARVGLNGGCVVQTLR